MLYSAHVCEMHADFCHTERSRDIEITAECVCVYVLHYEHLPYVKKTLLVGNSPHLVLLRYNLADRIRPLFSHFPQKEYTDNIAPHEPTWAHDSCNAYLQ